MNISFFSLHFVLFSIITKKSQSNQEQCFHVLLCTHYEPLQCFSTYFRKFKEIGVLRPIFPDYVNTSDSGPEYYDHDFLSLMGSCDLSCIELQTQKKILRILYNFLISNTFRTRCLIMLSLRITIFFFFEITNVRELLLFLSLRGLSFALMLAV